MVLWGVGSVIFWATFCELLQVCLLTMYLKVRGLVGGVIACLAWVSALSILFRIADASSSPAVWHPKVIYVLSVMWDVRGCGVRRNVAR